MGVVTGDPGARALSGITSELFLSMGVWMTIQSREAMDAGDLSDLNGVLNLLMTCMNAAKAHLQSSKVEV